MTTAVDQNEADSARCNDPPAPAGSVRDSCGRTVVPSRALQEGAEVAVVGLQQKELNGGIGRVVGRSGAAYYVHFDGAYGGTERTFERSNLTKLEDARWQMSAEIADNTPSAEESSIAAVRICGLQHPLKGMNGLYRRAGIKGTKFEQRLTDSDGVTPNILWKDSRDARWKIHNEDSTTRGWLASSPTLLGQWKEDPNAQDGTAVSGKPYPWITKASAAAHCHTER